MCKQICKSKSLSKSLIHITFSPLFLHLITSSTPLSLHLITLSTPFSLHFITLPSHYTSSPFTLPYTLPSSTLPLCYHPPLTLSSILPSPYNSLPSMYLTTFLSQQLIFPPLPLYMADCATPVIHVWCFQVYYKCRNIGVLHVLQIFV